MYVKELILFYLWRGTLQCVLCQCKRSTDDVVRDLQLGVVVQFVSGRDWLARRIVYDRFLAFDECGVARTFLWFRAGVSPI